MSYTLSNLIRDALLELGQLHAGEATDGSQTTVSDTTRNGEGRDNSWKGGTLIVTRTSDGLAPEGEFARITSSTAATWSLTFPTLTAAIASGDYYAFAGVEYPLQQMILLANKALKKWGDIELVDTTTLDTVASQTEYSASADWKRPYGPTRVDVARDSESNDQGWVTVYDWDYIPDTAGSGGKIVFITYPYSGKDIRVWYQGPHPEITTYDDVIDQRINPEAIIQALVTEALDYNNTKIRGGDKYLLQRQSKAEQDFEAARMNSPRTTKAKKSKLLILGDRGRNKYPGDRRPR